MNQNLTKVTLRLPYVGRTKRLVGGRGKLYSLEKTRRYFDAELWAISEALGIARKTVNAGNTPITIFCDSQKALRAVVLPGWPI